MVDVPDAAWNASASGLIRAPGLAVAAMMPCIKMAADALPKTSPLSPVARCSRSSVSWWERKVVFHAAHVLLARGGMSQSGRCFGKLLAARSEPLAIAASHLSSIRSFAQTDFFWADDPCVPEYVNRLKDAQKNSVQAKLPIDDKWLAAIATGSLLAAGSFLKQHPN